MRSDFAARLHRALGPPPLDPVAAAGALAADDAARSSAPEGARPALSPWAAWTLVAFLRYLPRQLWAGEVARKAGLKPGEHGEVAGSPGWTCTREGRHYWVSSAAAGETIDFELYEGSAEYVDPFAVLGGDQPPEHPAAPEARLLALHPVPERIVLAFDELHADGALIRHPREPAYRLTDQAKACGADVGPFVARWEDPAARLWLAASLGDWLLAAELSPGDDRIQRAAARALADRVRRLESRLDDPRFGKYALEALVEVAPADRVRRYLSAALEGAPDGLTRMAAKLIVADTAADFGDEMKALFERLSPEDETGLVTLTAGYLLDRGHAVALVLPSLVRAARVERVEGALFGKNLCVAEIALLALEYAPAEALPLVRLALRSSSAAVCQYTTAALVSLGGGWVERELLAVMSASTDEQVTATFRVALRRCGGPEAVAEVERWEAANESPAGPTWRHVASGFLEHYLTLVGERVERVRRALPGDFGG